MVSVIFNIFIKHIYKIYIYKHIFINIFLISSNIYKMSKIDLSDD